MIMNLVMDGHQSNKKHQATSSATASVNNSASVSNDDNLSNTSSEELSTRLTYSSPLSCHDPLPCINDNNNAADDDNYDDKHVISSCSDLFGAPNNKKITNHQNYNYHSRQHQQHVQSPNCQNRALTPVKSVSDTKLPAINTNNRKNDNQTNIGNEMTQYSPVNSPSTVPHHQQQQSQASELQSQSSAVLNNFLGLDLQQQLLLQSLKSTMSPGLIQEADLMANLVNCVQPSQQQSSTASSSSAAAAAAAHAFAQMLASNSPLVVNNQLSAVQSLFANQAFQAVVAASGAQQAAAAAAATVSPTTMHGLSTSQSATSSPDTNVTANQLLAQLMNAYQQPQVPQPPPTPSNQVSQPFLLQHLQQNVNNTLYGIKQLRSFFLFLLLFRFQIWQIRYFLAKVKVQQH